MCLTVKYGCKIEIAKNDIKGYKFVKKQWGYWKPMFAQHYRRFKYGELIIPFDNCSQPIKKLETHWYKYGYEINEGFHSRVNKSEHITNTICIIPKGSEICYGDDNDIVSNQIIVFKNCLQYLIYKLKKTFQK